MKKFLVMTTGRAGSTSFMNALAAHDDVSVPGKQIDCPDHEIIRLAKPDRYWSQYAALAGMPVNDELSLVSAFYASEPDAGFAGFKTMPNRHARLRAILAQHEPQVICIYRRDVPSTIASFIVARERGSWRRSGEPQAHEVHFSRDMTTQIDAHLTYLVRSINLFNRLSGAIRISFEDLCEPDFENTALNDYFCRPVRLADPRPPVDGSTYVGNWPELVSYVGQRLRAVTDAGAPAAAGRGISRGNA